jgi:hypothetical protein
VDLLHQNLILTSQMNSEIRLFNRWRIISVKSMFLGSTHISQTNLRQFSKAFTIHVDKKQLL